MKMHACVLVASLALAATAFSSTPVGKWTGKLAVSQNQPLTASQKSQVAAIKMTMVVKADHTFTAAINNGSSHHVSSGTWEAKDKAYYFLGKVYDGKTLHGPTTPQKATLSKDGATMEMTLAHVSKFVLKRVSK